MRQTLTRIADRLALVLAPELLASVGIEATTPLSVSVVGDSLVITPVDAGSEERRARFESAVKDTFDRYDDVFRRLAE